ncbi:zinc transporter family protein [Lysinibacillus sp. KU-BSD001]|uniref:zinc transporter family protein n=1 Tax=Lysinibacillus sp. KU-BSD001 TaxID=3141328 RepID=UPI0036E2ECC2
MIVSGFIFLSVSIGGGIAWLFSALFRQTTHHLSLLCGGFLIGLLLLEIIPSSLQMYELLSLILGFLIGHLLFLILHHFFYQTNLQKQSVYLLTIAILIHTIPLSLTIGNLLGNATLGIALTASIVLHHLPEGFAITTIMLSQGEKLLGLLLYFTGFAAFFGVFVWLGYYTNLSNVSEGILIGVSIGLIASTSISEFIVHNIRATSKINVLTYLLIGYLLSFGFHLVIG